MCGLICAIIARKEKHMFVFSSLSEGVMDCIYETIWMNWMMKRPILI